MNPKYDKEDFFTFLRILTYFSKHHNYKLYRTKLYKLVFLTQLFYFKEYGEKLFTQPFIKTLHHVKLKDIDRFIDDLINIGIITAKQESTGIILECIIDPINSIYDNNELRVLRHLCKFYSQKSSKDLEVILNSYETCSINPGTIIELRKHYHKFLEIDKLV